MGSVGQPRRRLPARVYWVRRGLVAGVALLLVVGVAQLIGTGSDAPAAVERALNTAAGDTPSTGSTPAGPVAPPRKLVRQRAQQQVLPEPDGPCLEDEVTVVPRVEKAAAGGEIPILLQLRGTRPACTFEADAETLAVKITSGEDAIWSIDHCTRAIAPTTVNVYSGSVTELAVRWHGRRSDEECTAGTAWAMPGYYVVMAAAKGSTPSSVQFQVTLPERPVRTRTVTPKPKASASPSQTASGQTSGQSGKPAPSGSASGKPTRKP